MYCCAKRCFLLPGLFAVLSLALVSCGGGGGNSQVSLEPQQAGITFGADRDVHPPQADGETMAMLQQRLEQELLGLDKELSSTTELPPSAGNEVVDLSATLLDPDGDGQLPPYGARLRWTERLLGDYDQNGVVNLADLVKLGQYFGYKVSYDDPLLHDGNPFIPSGDPEDFGEAGVDEPPSPDSGAFNWRLARIDGDGNGEIGLSDVTPIARHWYETISGYIVYRKGPSDAEFSVLPNEQNPGMPMTLSRKEIVDQWGSILSSLVPLQYVIPDFYVLDDPDLASIYSYKVVPYSTQADAAGPESPVLEISPFTAEPLNSGLLPVLDAEVISDGSVDGQSSASAHTITGVAPLTVRFDASASYIPDGFLANYLWDFNGDGIYEVSSGDNPVQEHTYEDNARFDATVRLLRIDYDPLRGASSVSRDTSQIGSTQSASLEVVVFSQGGNEPPIAAVIADKALGSIPLTVSFDASQSFDPDGVIEFYEWDFDGDGLPDFVSQSPTSTYTFALPALSIVRLKVVDDQGGYDTTTIPVITSNPDGNWPPTASIVINPTVGSAPLNADLDASDSVDPDGQIVSYEWDLNGDFIFDINSGPEAQLTYTFTESGVFNVWVRATDSAGQFDLARSVVYVNTSPFAGLEASPLSGPGPLTVDFDASSSLDLDGTIVKYEWDFESDGTYDQDTGTLSRVMHTFFTVGVQTVTVRVTDNLGYNGTQSVAIDVLEPRSNLTPTVSLVADVTDGPSPLTVVFTATGNDPDVDGGVDHYDWDYEGDGIYDEQTNILSPTRTHQYTSLGRFNATVRVVDVLGGKATASVEILAIVPGNDPPVADFSINPVGSPPGDPVTFDASLSTDDGNDIVLYEWDFEGDGTFDAAGPPGDALVVSHTYDLLGTYHVILRVTDGGGSAAYSWKNVVVGRVPEITIVSDRDYSEVPYATFKLDASRSKGVEGAITMFEWDLDGDGEFELQTGVSPFAQAVFDLDDLPKYPGGIVMPRLRVTNEIGATAETTFIQMPARDANGEPLRYPDGNLVLGEDGLVLLEEVVLRLFDDYDEVEDNDGYLTANKLIGSQPGGAFGPLSQGDDITAVRARFFSGEEIALTRNDPSIGDYVSGSLGQRNLARIYDGDDDDWYAFELSDGAHVRVNVNFENAQDALETDLILRLYGSNATSVLAQSDVAGNEQINYNFRDPGIYYVRVNRFVGQGQNYRLALVTTPLAYYPEGTLNTRRDGSGKDPADNDVYADADSLHDPQGSGLIPLSWGRAGAAADAADWYYFDYSSAVTTRVRLDFAHQLGDLDLYLYNKDLQLLGYSTTSDDGEELLRVLPDPGGVEPVYVKVVALYGGPVNYTLSAGYPAGPPTNVQASNGSGNGTITITWNPPLPGGNAPNGYKLFFSDEEDGFYNLLATINNPNNRTFVHNLTAAEDVAKQNQIFWYKAMSTRTGELDSDLSAADYGFVNDVRAAVGLEASYFKYLTKIIISFYDAPHDPSLGTGKFGVEPAVYKVYADPAGARPNTLVGSFYAGQGTEVRVPPYGGVPERAGELFSFEWSGGPDWSAPELRGLNIVIKVEARAPSSEYSSPFTAPVNGAITGLNVPNPFLVTDGLFPDKVRIRWTDNVTVEPDSYRLQFQGEYEYGWSNVTDPIPYVEDQTQYEYWVTKAGGAPESGKYRVRSFKETMGYSPWSSLNYGYASDNALKVPSYGADWYTTGSGPWQIRVKLGSPPFGTIVPTRWRYNFYRGQWYGWTGYSTFNREASSRVHPTPYNLTYGASDTRIIKIEVHWTDPTNPSKTLVSYHSISKSGSL